MFDTFARVKDAALEKGLAMALKPKLQRYGDLKELKIDTGARTIRAEIQLLGEPDPVKVSEACYRIERNGDELYAVFHGIKVNRPWAQNLLEDHFREIRVKLPEIVKNFVAG